MSEISKPNSSSSSKTEAPNNQSFNGNKTYGRIKSIVAQYVPEGIELPPPATRLQRLQQRYSDHVSGKVPLAPPESIALRNEIDRLSSLLHPGIANAWGDYSPTEKAYLSQQADAKRKFANSLGMVVGGPMSTLPAIARFLGAPEETVEQLAIVNADLAGVGLLGGKREFGNAEFGRRIPTSRWPSTNIGNKVANGTFVQQVKKIKPPPDGYKTYRTHGIKGDPLTSIEGRRMVLQLEKAGYSYEEAIAKASELIETGSTMPQMNPVEIGDRFYKVVPTGKLPSSQSEFWVTKEQIDAMRGHSVDFVANKLGLPLENQQTSSFDIVEIKAVRPTVNFTSRVAPTSQNGWLQSGDAIQSLLVDRTAFTPSVKTGIKLP